MKRTPWIFSQFLRCFGLLKWLRMGQMRAPIDWESCGHFPSEVASTLLELIHTWAPLRLEINDCIRRCRNPLLRMVGFAIDPSVRQRGSQFITKHTNRLAYANLIVLYSSSVAIDLISKTSKVVVFPDSMSNEISRWYLMPMVDVPTEFNPKNETWSCFAFAISPYSDLSMLNEGNEGNVPNNRNSFYFVLLGSRHPK